MLNHIVIMGRLTRDPELRRTQSGIAVASFTLAVDRDFGGQNGDRQTDFIDVVAWRNTGEFVSKYFSKGKMAVVSGRLQIRDWNDRDGNKRRSAEVVADNVYFGDSKRDGDNQQGGYSSNNNRSYSSDAPTGGSYGGQSSGYGDRGSYGGGQSSGYSQGGGGYASSDFAELNDDDGDLPF